MNYNKTRMFKKLFELYKVPLLISITLTIIFIALKLETQPIGFAYITLGTLLGTFFLDLDYLMYAFFLEPEADFSKTLAGFIRHKDFVNAFSYIYYHRDDIPDKTLNSGMFQVVLAGVTILAVSSTTGYFIRAFIISAFVNSMYRFSRYYFENKLNGWFWMLKNVPSKNAIYAYIGGLILVLFYCLGSF